MGRGTRSIEDYCVVLLMGKSLMSLINNFENDKFFGNGTLTHFLSFIVGFALTIILYARIT